MGDSLQMNAVDHIFKFNLVVQQQNVIQKRREISCGIDLHQPVKRSFTSMVGYVSEFSGRANEVRDLQPSYIGEWKGLPTHTIEGSKFNPQRIRLVDSAISIDFVGWTYKNFLFLRELRFC